MVSFQPAPSPQDSRILFPYHCQFRAEKQLHEEKRLESLQNSGTGSILQRPSGLDLSVPSPAFSSHPQRICHSRWGSGDPREVKWHCRGRGDGTVGTRKLCPVLSTRSAEPHRAGKTVHGRRGCRSALEGELKPSWNKGGGRARSTLVSTPMPGTLPLL